ncbi:MAG: MFS transporter [Spirochaetales bacterium]|nr:MAG: MFS transporter [Spirochaetales bacterium]
MRTENGSRKKAGSSFSLFDFPRYQALARALLGGIGKTAMVLPASFLVALGLGMTSLGMIFYLRDSFHASAAVIGSLYATWNICYFSGCIFLRPLSRLLLPRYSMLIASAVMGLAMFSLIRIGTLASSFAFYGIYGLATAFFFPPLMSWISAGIEGRELNKVMGRFNFSWSAGGIVSPYIAGFLVHKNPAYPIYGSMSLLFMASFIILTASLFITRIKNDAHIEKKAGTAEGEIIKGTILRFPSWGGIFFCYLAAGMLTSIFPLHARDNLKISEITVGLLFTVRACAMAGGFILMSRTEKWHFNRTFLLLSQVMVLVFLVAIMFTSRVSLLFLLMVMWGVITSANYSAALFHGAAGATERLKRMALHEAILTAGSMAGSLIGGAVFQRFSMQTAFGTAAVLQCALIIFSAVFMAVKKHEKPAV